MRRIKGFAFAMEWSWRRRCGVFGNNWYCIDKSLDEFIPFSNVFEARTAELKQWKERLHVVGEVTRSFVFEFELVVATDPSEEDEISKMGSLVIFTHKRFGWDGWWRVVGGGRDFLVHFVPYKRIGSALKTLRRERDKGNVARLGSWKIRRMTSNLRMAANWPPRG